MSFRFKNQINSCRVAAYIYRIRPDILLTSMNIVDPFFYTAGFLMYVMIKPHSYSNVGPIGSRYR